MISAPVRHTIRLGLVVSVIALPLLWLELGPIVAKSFFMGYAAATLSVSSFGYLALAMQVGRGISSRQAVLASSVVLILKLPLIGIICFVGLADGMSPRMFFLAGAAMVYFALIVFACKNLRSSS